MTSILSSRQASILGADIIIIIIKTVSDQMGEMKHMELIIYACESNQTEVISFPVNKGWFTCPALMPRNIKGFINFMK